MRALLTIQHQHRLGRLSETICRKWSSNVYHSPFVLTLSTILVNNGPDPQVAVARRSPVQVLLNILEERFPDICNSGNYLLLIKGKFIRDYPLCYYLTEAYFNCIAVLRVVQMVQPSSSVKQHWPQTRCIFAMRTPVHVFRRYSQYHR